ncbi:MAG TPA: M20/M25/M40 family metallo-hydrolase [Pirellulales bacterium]|nr:M20/M25/M40 family metallo-hydrolase [Pirellulales bacterium]
MHRGNRPRRILRPSAIPLGLRARVCLLLAAAGLTSVVLLSRQFVFAAENAETESASTNAAIEKRMAETDRYLASEKLEGRGLGTHGIDIAADYVAQEFKKAGLKTDLYDGGPFQKFNLTVGSKLGPDERNHADLIGPAESNSTVSRKIPLKLGTDFTPLTLGGSAKIDAPLVFAGYGITAKAEKYDDYAGIDVKDKAVIVLRHQPQRSNPHGLFGDHDSIYAALSRKVSNAYEHGAAAVIFCNDDAEIQKVVGQSQKRLQAAIDELGKANDDFKKAERPSLDQIVKHAKLIDELTDRIKRLTKELVDGTDPLLRPDRGGEESEGREFPVLHCRRAEVAQALKAALGTDLAALEHEIDATGSPKSRELTGWRIAGETNLIREQTAAKNVLGILEGEGPLAEETIVIGAHYDHLGYGGNGSLAPGVHAIHPGADDNASGDAALLEVARELAGRAKKLPRRILFIAFTGEERGLLGSARYVRDPLVPLDKTIAMLNLDMVGRMRDDKLIVYDNDTSPQFDPLIERVNAKFKFKIAREPGGFGPSDHSSFYGKQIPVLFFFTGTHSDYHRPSDTADKINVADMRRVAQMVADVAAALAEADERPEFSESKASKGHGLGADGDRPYFGSIPDFGQEAAGYAISGVTKDSPAQRGGLKAGDAIVRLGDSKIGNLEDFDSALRKYKAGDKVEVVVLRSGKEVKLEVTLEAPR